ncbi:unnamed protein product, partial [Clonostachys solani]
MLPRHSTRPKISTSCSSKRRTSAVVSHSGKPAPALAWLWVPDGPIVRQDRGRARATALSNASIAYQPD